MSMKKSKGFILPVSAFVLILLLSISSFVIWLSSHNMTSIKGKNISDALSLVILREYQQHFCEDLSGEYPSTYQIRECNKEKYAYAMLEAKKYLESQDNFFKDYELACTPTLNIAGVRVCPYNLLESSVTNIFKVELGKYFDELPTVSGSNPCSNNYPCWRSFEIAREPAFANAVRVRGRVTESEDKGSFVSFFNKYKYSEEIEFESFSRVIPMAGFFLGDLSASIQSSTHISIPHMNDYTQGTSNPWLTDDARFPTSPQLPSLPPSPDKFIAQPSFFAFNAYDDGGALQIGLEAGDPGDIIPPHQRELYWKHMRDFRADIPFAYRNFPFIHTKDDYALITRFTEEPESFLAYDGRGFHVDPTDATSNINMFQGTAADIPSAYSKIDLFRRGSEVNLASPTTYLGAEPLRSVLKGLNRALQKFIQKGSVHYDDFGIIFYTGDPNGLKWNHTGLLGKSYAYWLNVLDYENFQSIDNFNNISNGVHGPELTPINSPLWVRLGLFPHPSDSTPSLPALNEAIRQLSQGDQDRQLFIANISDNLPTCFRDGVGYDCGSDAESYVKAMNDTRNFVSNSLVGDGSFPTQYHNLMIGTAAKGHYWYEQKDDGTCKDDEEVRLEGRDFVQNTPYESVTEDKWRLRFRYPLNIAGHGYQFSLATGGIFKSFYTKIGNPFTSSPYIDRALYNSPTSCAQGESYWCNVVTGGGTNNAYIDSQLIGSGCETIDETIEDFVDNLFDQNSHFQLLKTPRYAGRYFDSAIQNKMSNTSGATGLPDTPDGSPPIP